MTAVFAFDMSALYASLNEIASTMECSPYYYAYRFQSIASPYYDQAETLDLRYESDGDVCMEIVKPRIVIPLYDEDGEALFDTSIPMEGKPSTNPSRYYRTPYPPPLPVINRSHPIPVSSTYAPINSTLPIDEFNETVFDILNDFCQTHGSDVSEGGIQYHYTTINMSFHTHFEYVQNNGGISKHTIQFSVNYDASKMYHTSVDGLVFEEIAELYDMLHHATCLNAPCTMTVEDSVAVCIMPEPLEPAAHVVYRYY